MTDKKLTYGDYINWVDAKTPGTHESCTQCGRKVGKKSYWVEVNTSGQIIKNGDKDSQGCWAVGSECAKAFNPEVLQKLDFIS